MDTRHHTDLASASMAHLPLVILEADQVSLAELGLGRADCIEQLRGVVDEVPGKVVCIGIGASVLSLHVIVAGLWAIPVEEPGDDHTIVDSAVSTALHVHRPLAQGPLDFCNQLLVVHEPPSYLKVVGL